jgi:tetratricopeptide (TPR) repeat protein
MRGVVTATCCLLALHASSPALADILPRTGPSAGSVIARKSGEEARFIEVSDWRGIDVEQDLLPGDTLRTNAFGQLAVLFSDRTQLRLGRNTTLVVRQIGTTSNSVIGLEGGSVWGRAETGGIGLTVETPAAAAAIRGTDFSLTVEGERTSLVVMDGRVDLANEFGSVSVAAGEAAVARIGQAPAKLVIVAPDDREQMLFYLSLRGSFTALPVSSLPFGQMRQAHRQVQSIPPAQRTAEDWVTFAEGSLSLTGRAQTAAALGEARALPLTVSQRARLDLVEAMLLAAARRYADAAALFHDAMPHLDPERRSVATFGGYFARSLADPDLAEAPPPASQGPYGALAEAYATGFLRDVPAAIDVLRQAERRYPGDPALPATRAHFALLMDDREQVAEAVDRALALDPENPIALEARASFRAGLQGDVSGAYEDLRTAVAIAPGSSSLWNSLGLIQSERGADREAEAALKRAIELDPEDPVGHANLAIVYLDQDRLGEARDAIDRAMELDPAFDAGLIARGRHYLQTGEMEKARADLLAGTTANPAYAQGLLMLGAADYESGDRVPAAQALRNADRLDPNDPVTSSFATAIAIDDYDADAAIAHAQEALRRARARGGSYASLSANRDAGSLLNSAFRLQGLDAWGRFYGDVVFDPFSGATLLDQSVSGSPDPFTTALEPGSDPVEPTSTSRSFSSLFQGLMLSPDLLSGRSRSANLIRRPFLEATLGGGFVRTEGGDGWTSTGEIQAFDVTPFPWSLYVSGEMKRDADIRERSRPGTATPFVSFDLSSDLVAGQGYATARPTPYDRVVIYADINRSQPDIADATVLLDDPLLPFNAISYDRALDLRSARGGIGWSHSVGYRNVISTAFFISDLDQSSVERGLLVDIAGPELVGLRELEASARQRTYTGAVNHTVDIGDISWRYGLEAGTVEISQRSRDFLAVPDSVEEDVDIRDLNLGFGRAYADAAWHIGPDLRAEAGLFATYLDGDLSIARAEPRFGMSWSPLDGHWLSSGFIRETNSVNETTLAPVGIVGMQPNQVPLDVGGSADTFAARWSAEWTSRLFTSLDYQHQSLRGLAITPPGFIDSTDLGRGTIDRVAATANFHLGHGFGLFGTFAYAASENRDRDSAGFGEALPFLPETSARFGATWVNPANVKVTLAGTYIGDRLGAETGPALSSYWTVDAAATWEPFDKRYQLELSAFNLLGEDFEVAPATPGWGRTFTGSLKVRF